MNLLSGSNAGWKCVEEKLSCVSRVREGVVRATAVCVWVRESVCLCACVCCVPAVCLSVCEASA